MANELDRHLRSLVDGAVPWVLVEGDGTVASALPPLVVVVPGSFDPVHEGHVQLAQAAVEAVAAAGLGDRPLLFELSVHNVDKPPLHAAEVHRRIARLRHHGPVLVTAAPRFLDKARVLRGAVFAVGHDTAVRLVDPAYYGDDTGARDEALAMIAAAGCRFAVAGRALGDEHYRDLDDVTVPDAHRELFLPIPGFRVDISSTQLRRDA